MKTLFLILFLIPALCFGQQRKDERIIVTVMDTANLFNRVAMVLYENNYSLEQKDESLKFLSTTEKGLKKWNADMKVRALIKGNTVTFTGLVALNQDLIVRSTSKQYGPIYFGGAKGSIIRDSWDELSKLAHKIGGKITYSK